MKVKRSAVILFCRGIHKAKGARIYMSSVTDPYQPVERIAELTRGILEAMVEVQPGLTVQTRSCAATARATDATCATCAPAAGA